MSDFLISLLDLCLVPFRMTSNLVIFIPTACLTVMFLVRLISCLIHGGRRV